MFRKISNASVKLVNNFLPDAFIFCIVLTIVVFILGYRLLGQQRMEPACILHADGSGCSYR